MEKGFEWHSEIVRIVGMFLHLFHAERIDEVAVNGVEISEMICFMDVLIGFLLNMVLSK